MPLSEKKKASNTKWDTANLKRMSLAMRLDDYEKMKAHLETTGESVNGFIIRAIMEKLERDTAE